MTGATTLRRLYEVMALIRAFELRVAELYRDGEIAGFVHTSLGQEAVASGVCGAVDRTDYMTTSHRGHGHMLAKGADVDAMMAELFGRSTGLCRGRGGSMHVADPAVGALGANAIVGAGIPLAVGAALSSNLLGQGRIAVAFFGEGAANQGAFHEAINLAAIWELPVLFVCENNKYAEFTDSTLMSRVSSVAQRATAAYGVPATSVDGNDVLAVYEASVDAVATCRDGNGPVLIEAETYRWHGHYEGDQQPYKPRDESEAWHRRDPLTQAAQQLLSEAGTEEEIALIGEAAEARVARAVELARAATDPHEDEAYEHVFVS